MKEAGANIEALIFDVDGTLADTDEIHRQSFNDSFTKFELDWLWSKKEYENLLKISGGRERIKYYSSNHKGKVQLSDSNIKAIHEYKNLLYQSKITEKKIKLRTGVNELITTLQQNNIKIAMATSSSLNNINKLLTCCIGRDWQDIFTVIETSENTPEKKPNPSVYRNVLSKLKVDSRQTIAIEDTPNGLMSAHSAGIKTIVTVHQMTERLCFPAAALVVDSIGTSGEPFKLIKGDSFGNGYISLELLNKLIR